MIFTRAYFWGFFLVVLFFYSILYKRKVSAILPVRYFFITKPADCLYFAFLTIADYLLGHAISGPERRF
jgi:hypothetical protein